MADALAVPHHGDLRASLRGGGRSIRLASGGAGRRAGARHGTRFPKPLLCSGRPRKKEHQAAEAGTLPEAATAIAIIDTKTSDAIVLLHSFLAMLPPAGATRDRSRGPRPRQRCNLQPLTSLEKGGGGGRSSGEHPPPHRPLRTKRCGQEPPDQEAAKSDQNKTRTKTSLENLPRATILRGASPSPSPSPPHLDVVHEGPGPSRDDEVDQVVELEQLPHRGPGGDEADAVPRDATVRTLRDGVHDDSAGPPDEA